FDETWAAHPDMQTAYETAFAQWETMGQVQFVELTDFTTHADMIESLCSRTKMDEIVSPQTGVYAYHLFPTQADPEQGLYCVTPSFGGTWSANSMLAGGLGVFVFMHELGHGLGLKHPFDTSGVTLPASLDHELWTIMSYNANYTFDASGQIILGTNNPIV